MEKVHIVAFNADTLEVVYSLTLNDTQLGQITNDTEIILNAERVGINEITNAITSAKALVRIEPNGRIINRIEIDL